MIPMIDLAKKVELLARENSPTILTVFGVTGTLTTAYLAASASFEAAEEIREMELREHMLLLPKERALLVWKLYIPTALSASATIASILGATRISSRRTAALTIAYSLSDKAFVEYREKVANTLGEGKERKIRDELAQDRVTQSPPASPIIAGTGKVICCELYTKRYFECDMETLRRAENDINARINGHGYASLSDLYELLGLEYTSFSNDIGWDGDHLNLHYSTVLSSDGQPCIAFEYNYTNPV